MRSHRIRQNVSPPFSTYRAQLLFLAFIPRRHDNNQYGHSLLFQNIAGSRSPPPAAADDPCSGVSVLTVSRMPRHGLPALAGTGRRGLPGGSGRWRRAVGAGLGAALCAVPVAEVRDLRRRTCSPAC